MLNTVITKSYVLWDYKSKLAEIRRQTYILNSGYFICCPFCLYHVSRCYMFTTLMKGWITAEAKRLHRRST